MLKWCVDKWFANKESLRQVLMNKTNEELKECDYNTLIELVVEYILNEGEESYLQFDSNAITTINEGIGEGISMFMIPRKMPDNAGDYLLTYISYGSCELDDMLARVHHQLYKKHKKKIVVDDFLKICQSFICDMVKPYNTGFCEDKRFNAIVGKDEKKIEEQEIAHDIFEELFNIIFGQALLEINEEDIRWLLGKTKKLFFGREIVKGISEEMNPQLVVENFLDDPEKKEALCNAKGVIFIFSGDCSLIFMSDFFNLILKSIGREDNKFIRFGARYEEIPELKIMMIAAE